MIEANSDFSQQTSASPQGRESLAIQSGHVLILDQYMLANEQFKGRIDQLQTEGQPAHEALAKAAQQYGGCVVELVPGSYDVFRHPQKTLIALAQENTALQDLDDSSEEVGEYGFDFDAIIDAKGNAQSISRVYVDTRCVVFLDAAKALDAALLGKYRDIRQSQGEKQARDFLREQGGAVRYGFNRYGDELGVFKIDGGRIVALWPDVTD